MKIDSVKVFSRRDCCYYRIDGVEVYVDDQLCGVLSSQRGGSWSEVKCNGAVGKKVTLDSGIEENGGSDRGTLNFCGIRVYGDKEDEEGL